MKTITFHVSCPKLAGLPCAKWLAKTTNYHVFSVGTSLLLSRHLEFSNFLIDTEKELEQDTPW